MTIADVMAPDNALAPVYAKPPLDIVDGDGVYLIDAAGNRYLDFVAGIAVNALGYNDAGLRNAMRDAADGLVHVSNLFRTEPAVTLAAWLTEHTFASHVFFCNSGAEANEGAFKFARRWARTLADDKFEIVALRGAFHGRLFGTLAATDRPSYQHPFRPLAPGISICERDLSDILASIDRDRTAAVIVEPVQGEGGVRVLDPGFLRELRAATAERNVALIFDEIQCGFGRTGSLFAYEQTGVTPDILTVAKPIAGGLPMGAILMKESIASALKPGDHGTTFGGGPFVSRVALHVVERLADPRLLSAVRENGEWLGDRLRSLAALSPKVRAVRGVGYMWGIDVTVPAASIVAAARDAGLLVCSAGEHTLRLLPPLVTTREELLLGVQILEGVLCE